MTELTSITHLLLTEYVIKLLKKGNIRTIDDFVKESPYKLAKITNLGENYLNFFQLHNSFPFHLNPFR